MSLQIMDRCFATSVAISGTKDLLAASGIDRPAPGSITAGSSRVLVENKTRLNDKSAMVAQLHAELIRSSYKHELTTMSVHIQLSG